MNEQLQPIPPGDAAPGFTLRHTLHTSISLHYFPPQPIVLVFYPFDWEPVSRQQLSLYQDYLVEFERLGACLLGISVDHLWSHDAFARAVRLRFPLLSDAHVRGAVAGLYGVYREQEERSARALFVIDSKRFIRYSQVYPDNLNPGVNDILTTLEAMADEDVPVPAYRTSQPAL
jgi:peroxiredoxin